MPPTNGLAPPSNRPDAQATPLPPPNGVAPPSNQPDAQATPLPPPDGVAPPSNRPDAQATPFGGTVRRVSGGEVPTLLSVHPRDRRRASKLLALLLRHDPGRGGLVLDRAGWADVGEVLAALRRLGLDLTEDDVEEVVAGGDRPRFEVSGGRIRARYGHSVDVDPGYAPHPPPPVLYHGTAADRVETILREGVRPMARRLVHLSATPADARRVGARHGRPVVLGIDAAAMAAEGAVFHRLPGGVWLVAEVPPGRITEVLR